MLGDLVGGPHDRILVEPAIGRWTTRNVRSGKAKTQVDNVVDLQRKYSDDVYLVGNHHDDSPLINGNLEARLERYYGVITGIVNINFAILYR